MSDVDEISQLENIEKELQMKEDTIEEEENEKIENFDCVFKKDLLQMSQNKSKSKRKHFSTSIKSIYFYHHFHRFEKK